MPEVARAQPSVRVERSPLRRWRWPAFSRELGLAGLTVFVIVLFSILYPYSFMSVNNLNAILRNLAFQGILAIGMMMLMVGGAFDLSVGAMASLIGVITGRLLTGGWPAPLAIVAGLAIAALGGLLNGFVIAKVRVNALIATLGTLGMFQGLALLIGGPGVPFEARFAQTKLLGVQLPVWLLGGLALIGHYGLAHTRFFRQYYYVGSNAKAARLSGINVERLQMLAFTIMGVIAGFAGIVFASRLASAGSTVGRGTELQAITAAILGGASLTGGKGTIWGAMIGVFFMALMQNILIISKKVPSEWQEIIVGAVLVLAVALDSVMNRKRL
jgi:ribose transport system permease protein